MTSAFDPASFLHQRTEEQSVRRPPIPAGTELLGVIGELKVDSFANKKDPGGPDSIRLSVPIKLDLSSNPTIRQLVGTDNLTLTDTFFLDYTDSGALDYGAGRNNGLRRYRDATGLNTKGQSFGLLDLQGRIVKARISHRTYENEIYDQIDSVSKP